MSYKQFEDLPVWQEAARLYEATEDLLENKAFVATRSLKDQLDRAALSVSNNIAEGFGEARLTSFLHSSISLAARQVKCDPY
jgi:four helix bundle protein